MPPIAGSACSRAPASIRSRCACPAHPVARALIEATGAPLVAPSANRSGRVSPTRAEHVAEDLAGRIDWILDAGATPLGLESTIVACVDGAVRLLRPGAISREALEAALGEGVLESARRPAPKRREILAPGMLSSHYAPRARLRLNATDTREGEAALDFGGILAASGAKTRLDLSPAGDLAEAAANLFAYLRALDAGRRARDRRGADPAAPSGRRDQRPTASRRGATSAVDMRSTARDFAQTRNCRKLSPFGPQVAGRDARGFNRAQIRFSGEAVNPHVSLGSIHKTASGAQDGRRS